MTFSSEEQALSRIDPVMSALIDRNGPIHHAPDSDYFASLTESIVSQQISVKAAASIFSRFKDATGLDQARVAALSETDARAIGLSGQKYKYLRDLADHFVRDSMVFNHLDTLSDGEVISELTRIKGIGVWTAQMFLMFTLVRMDVFAPDDRGLQLAIKQLYGLSDVPPRSELEAMAEKWSPYRTVASWHLWRLLDNKPL